MAANQNWNLSKGMPRKQAPGVSWKNLAGGTYPKLGYTVLYKVNKIQYEL